MMPFESVQRETSEAARWRIIRRKVIRRFVVVTVGILLWALLAFLTSQIADNSAWRAFSIDGATYAVVGAGFGFVWPHTTWRLGLWLSAIWLPFILGAFLFSDPPRVIEWKQELLALSGVLMIPVGACLGAWIGAHARQRFQSCCQ